MRSPTQQRWVVAKRVFQYLQFTKTMKIVFERHCDQTLQGATGADWSGDASDRRSTTGFCYKLKCSNKLELRKAEYSCLINLLGRVPKKRSSSRSDLLETNIGKFVFSADELNTNCGRNQSCIKLLKIP